MKIIKQNPFRVLGLLGNSTERELQKQIGTIKAFARVGKFKSFNYDLEIIGNISRSIDDIQLAASSIEQAPKKLHYSLFWFIKNSSLDEVALNHLNQNTDKAIEIWNKTLKDEVTPKNYSAYLNLSTLYLALSTIGEELRKNELQQAINLKGLLINSESLKVLSKEVTGNGVLISSDDVNKLFVDEILNSLKPYLDKSKGITTNELISLFESYPPSIQKYLASKFTEVPVTNIENSIDKIISKRKSNPRDAEEYGEELYKSTKSDITLLKKLLGSQNVQYQMLVNKLANEILQCSIDFFNTLRDEGGEYDPGDDALKIAKYAKSIGSTGQTRSRIDESLEFIENWVDDKPEREKYSKIEHEIQVIIILLQKFEEDGQTFNSITELLHKTKPRLEYIKEIVGFDDEQYLNISSAVVQNALGMIIEVVNSAQERLSYDSTKLVALSNTISNAMAVLNLMGSIDMFYEVRERYVKNKQTISSINQQLNSISTTKTQSTNSTSSGNSSNPGCIIVIVIGVIIAIIIAIASDNDSSSSYQTNSSSSSFEPSDYSTTSSVQEQPESEFKGNQLNNGSSPYNALFGSGIYNKNYNNEVTFKNGYNTDAIVCLVDYYSGKTIRNEYIQASSTFQMTNIPNGTYYMKVFSGKDWNPNKILGNGKIKGGFDTNSSFYQSKSPSDLIKLNDDGNQYSSYEITLYQVDNGNMEQQNISENSFFN
ncbi:hypothetical protein [uncultured Draconibacterium sp.]|uniref:tetratricopeptide repeat protein n=1 Tax=uncultured Draconibacterium sp. TaxID=1573823 RepID=UPI0032177F39